MVKLDKVHPELRKRVERVLTRMAEQGHPMKIIQGYRTAEEQAALFALGRTKPGRKVTNCDGKIKRSNHQVDEKTGWCYAVDVAFQGKDPFRETHPWDTLGHAARAEGLVWGGDWLRFRDRPHLELAVKDRKVV